MDMAVTDGRLQEKSLEKQLPYSLKISDILEMKQILKVKNP